MAYQTNRSDLGGPWTTKDFSLGARGSYAFTKHFKGLAELSTTTRKGAGADQRLSKLTLAGALALSEDFWSRPELRLYVTKANWNQAAAVANAGSLACQWQDFAHVGGRAIRSVVVVPVSINRLLCRLRLASAIALSALRLRVLD
jgi:maltoporin